MRVLDKLFKGYGNISVALRITIIYAILGSLWIAFSDKLLISIFDPDTVSEYALLQTYKGWFFILLTSIILFFLIIGNIKKLKISEELRYQSESRYRTVFENTGTAIAILEEDLTVSLVNEKFVELSEFDKSDIEGRQKWINFIEQEDLAKIIEYHRQRKNNDDDLAASYEFRFITNQNHTRHVLATLAFLPGTQQSIISLIDISDRKELETKYLRAQRMESIGTLSGGIAHDLNNILAPILLSVEALHNIMDDDKGSRFIQIVKSSAQRGADLVNQILTFSRGVHGEHLAIQPRYLIREIGQIMRATFPKTIQIETDIPNDLSNISGNATQVHQAILNICVNARDAMPDGGVLRIQTENITIDADNEHHYPEIQHGSYVSISISDTGSGIPEDIKDKLFRPFFSTKEEGKGTGLGLTTVEYILRNHNGYVRVDSEQGRGSTFSLYFPVTEAPPVKEELKEETMPMGNGERLLVIDDEAAVCEMISEILRSHNYDVMIAKDGTEGLATYLKHKHNIDLVLTDSDMPYLRGEQLIKSLQETNPNVKIFITTGSKEMQKRFKHLQPPIVGYLEKPYSTHSLLTQLHEILKS